MASAAQAVVTLNLKHFPPEACEPFGIDAIHPDVFLLDLYGLDGVAVFSAVQRQAAVLKRPSMTLDGLLELLEPTAPNFVQALRAHR